MRVRPKPCHNVRFSLRKLTPFFAGFPQVFCRLAAVAAVAKASQVAAVSEDPHVALVVNTVVNVCRSHSFALSCALLTERLTEKLCGSKIVRPDRQQIQPVPFFCRIAAVVASFRRMYFAIPALHKCKAAGLAARSHGFRWHLPPPDTLVLGLSPPGKTKTPAPAILPMRKFSGTGGWLRTAPEQYSRKIRTCNVCTRA